MKRLVLAVLAVVFFAILGARWAVSGPPAVSLVPLGPVPGETLEALAGHVRGRFGLDVGIVREVPLEESTLDRERRQLVAEELIALMQRAYWWRAWNPRVVLIGITRYDMYSRARPDWRFVFNWYMQARTRRAAVMSMARLDPVNLGEPPDAERFGERLRKTISRDIGFLVYARPTSPNPRSVLFSPLLGVDDLDRIGEDF
ncbi:MAG: hypothetical protein HY294_13730 [Candidatus Rokubacteria bacterium]|nr:hypothetical protein [Candidatus Rokubacteria bacterium]MBI3827048.1 hypothetical protein [Candidatus Rokubacteria bacterium]